MGCWIAGEVTYDRTEMCMALPSVGAQGVPLCGQGDDCHLAVELSRYVARLATV
jgi:hypothetical protein